MNKDSKQSHGPLAGVKVIELAGIGPAPLCCTLLSDMGADVMRIDRNAPSGLGSPRTPRTDLLRRGRPSVSIDMKHPNGIATLLRLVEQADVIIDPFRPGVTERLGLGPEDCLARNPKLVYGRMTGWGQDGSLSQAAGHDLNYLALTGVLHAIGPKELPVPPLNVVADMGGGAMFLAVGVLAGVIEARQSGQGQVVDTAMTEGSAFLGTGAFGTLAAGDWVHERTSNILDGGAHFYRCYKTADGKFVSIASIEAKFYAILLEKLRLDPAELPAQMDRP
ncbi:MAG: CaiB/BaiF CoA-transferase family protein, partial [Alphaproteobacteria bacterium]|nr:CaiB/BaiF CoA-transferase family protein [Alphaproteobacteria bacterium]